MKLRDWRQQENLSTHAAALRLGLKGGGGQIFKYEHGRVPAPAQMKLIKAVTGGAVTADDFPDDTPEPDVCPECGQPLPAADHPHDPRQMELPA